MTIRCGISNFTPQKSPSAFQVLCKDLLRKEFVTAHKPSCYATPIIQKKKTYKVLTKNFLRNFKVSRHKVITKLLEIPV